MNAHIVHRLLYRPVHFISQERIARAVEVGKAVLHYSWSVPSRPHLQPRSPSATVLISA